MLPCKAKHKLTKGFWNPKPTGELEDVTVLGFSFRDRSGRYMCTYVLKEESPLDIKEDDSDNFNFDKKVLFGVE